MAGLKRGPLSFPKASRLRKRPEFLEVKEKGRSASEGPLAASWKARSAAPVDRNLPPQARVGLTVSSKVGNAVVRNRVKRRLREAVRRELALLPAVDLVLVARASAPAASVEELRAAVRKLVGRMTRGGR